MKSTTTGISSKSHRTPDIREPTLDEGEGGRAHLVNQPHKVGFEVCLPRHLITYRCSGQETARSASAHFHRLLRVLTSTAKDKGTAA